MIAPRVSRAWVVVKRLVIVIIVVLVADASYVAYVPDVEFLKPMYTCMDSIRKFADGEPAQCPLCKGERSYHLFDAITENPTEHNEISELTVIAAETKLRHRIRSSLIFPNVRFAVLFLNDGRAVQWIGNEASYAEAMKRAEKSKEGCRVSVFFSKCSEYTL